MRHKNRETMAKIVKIIEEYRMERSEIPSIGQIAEKVHMSRSTAYYYLRDMRRLSAGHCPARRHFFPSG